MKAGIKVLVVVLAAITFMGVSDDPKEVRIKVNGMMCGNCVMKVEKAVSSLKGVEHSEVNLTEGWATVRYASASVSPADLIASIKDAGFEASVLEAGAPSSSQKGGDSGAKLEEVRSQLAKTKDGMMQDGKYSCCISPSCDFCALAADGCPCGENLSKGGAVCHECKGGWMAGYGALQDIKPEDVKVLTPDVMKKMYKMKADMLKKARQSKPAK